MLLDFYLGVNRKGPEKKGEGNNGSNWPLKEDLKPIHAKSGGAFRRMM